MDSDIDIIDPLYQYLRKNKPNDFLMPVTSKKNPIYKHKNDAWSWDKVVQNGKDFGPDKYQAILLKYLIIIDIDSKSLLSKYEDKFPILQTCVRGETSKGAHYYYFFFN